MSFNVPQPFQASVQGPIGPVVAQLAGPLPGIHLDPLQADVHVALDPVQANAHVELDPVQANAHVGLDPVQANAHVGLDPVQANAHVGLDPVQADAHVAVDPLAVDVAVSRIPDVRAHVPANFSVSLCVFGITIFSIHLRGEAQVVTEPYRPNPAEQAVGPPEPPP